MRVTILTVGSRGDVQPYVALGVGLQAAGYDVQLATHVEYESLVRSQGLDFTIIASNPFLGMNAGVGEQPAQSDGDANRPFAERFGRAVEQWMAGGLDASRDSDVIIYSQLCFVGAYVAEKLGVPAFAANYSPLTPTRAFPTIYSRVRLRLGGTFNLLTHIVDQQLFWRQMGGMINRARGKVLGLPPLPFFGPYRRLRRERHPILYGYSPHVVPRPSDWGDWIYVTGYWLLDRLADWQPPADLVAFLEAGPPPVYLGLGSIANTGPARVTRVLLAALARAGQRVIVAPGQVDLDGAALPKETYITGPTNHDWLLPRTAAVICHGGAGTIGAALKAGVPTMSVPFFGDQFFWAWRTHAIGVAPRPYPYNRMTPERALDSIRTLVGNEGMRRTAAALGEKVRQEDGVGRAIEAIERELAGFRRMKPVASGL